MPSEIVRISAWMQGFFFILTSLWCLHVIVIPDANRVAVFNSGILSGLSGLIPVGGQQQPSSGVGANLL